MSIFDEFKLLFNTDKNSYLKLNEKSLFVLNMWAGNSNNNLGMSLDIEEKKLSGVSDSILMKELYLRINKRTRFIKFPKGKKAEYELEWLIPLFKNFYGWSDNEIDVFWNLIIEKLKDINIRELIAKQFGLENPDRKKLSLEPLNKKIVKPKISVGQRRLF